MLPGCLKCSYQADRCSAVGIVNSPTHSPPIHILTYPLTIFKNLGINTAFTEISDWPNIHCVLKK